MNYYHFLAFFIYFAMVFIVGIGIFAILNIKDRLTEQRILLLGEILLLGSIFIIGELVTLSFTGLYYGFNLWIVVFLNLFFLLRHKTREYLGYFFSRKISFDLPLITFIFFLIIFTFRNCFPLMDNDSHASYLWMQKLWLLHKTSIFNDVLDIRAYVPHLESVPYGLGIALFGSETLFQGLINTSWRWIVLLLVFGYTSYRFNRFYGLAAALLVLLNDHFFYSGVYYPLLLNGAVIAFFFAAVYNFWESNEQNNTFRFMLSLLFLFHVIITKFQMLFVATFFFVLFLVLKKDRMNQFREIFRRKNWMTVFLFGIFFIAIWFIKSYIATGLPTFPVLAGKFHIMGWTPESGRVYLKVMGGIDPGRFFKYMNYLFIWPGINPAKIVIMVISLLPFIHIFSALHKQVNPRENVELNFWLSASVLFVFSITLACHQDPRYYRYGMGVMAFAGVYAVRFIFYNILRIKKDVIIAGILFISSLAPIKLIFSQGTNGDRALPPSMQQNIDVLFNKIHTSDLMDSFYPRNRVALEGYKENPDKISKAAWLHFGGVIISSFILPERPHVGLWYSPLIRWDSYEKEELIVKDLRAHGIEWIMDPRGEGEKLKFLTPEEFAKEAVNFDRYPKQTNFDYGFPKELSEIKY